MPWEGRTAWLRELLAGPRWKVAALLLGLLLAIVVVWRAAEGQSRDHRTRVAIAEVHRAIERFRADVGRCPASTHELMHPPRSGARYLRELPDDGWDRALFIQCPARHDPHAADVVSAGPSGSFFVDDNIR